MKKNKRLTLKQLLKVLKEHQDLITIADFDRSSLKDVYGIDINSGGTTIQISPEGWTKKGRHELVERYGHTSNPALLRDEE